MKLIVISLANVLMGAILRWPQYHRPSRAFRGGGAISAPPPRRTPPSQPASTLGWPPQLPQLLSTPVNPPSPPPGLAPPAENIGHNIAITRHHFCPGLTPSQALSIARQDTIISIEKTSAHSRYYVTCALRYGMSLFSVVCHSRGSESHCWKSHRILRPEKTSYY